jgi:hypothetical protein
VTRHAISDKSGGCPLGSKGDYVVARLSSNSQPQLQVEDRYLIALAKQGSPDAYDRIVRRYYGFVRLKASSYFLVGGDSDDLIQEGLVGLYKAVRDYRSDRDSSSESAVEIHATSARSSSEEITWLTGSWTGEPAIISSSVASESPEAPAGVLENETYWFSGLCLLRVAVFTAVMI